MSPALHDVRQAAQDVIDAAVDWVDTDFGESGELEAAAALADAVRAFQRAAEHAGLAPRVALDRLSG